MKINPTTSPLVSIKHFSKKYGSKEVVKNLNLHIQKGEVYALVGANGAGKSTTLRTISTLLSPTSGSISIAGFALGKENQEIRQVISYLPEEAGAYKNIRGDRYLSIMAELSATSKAQAALFYNRGREISGLGDRLKDKVSTYSKGMSRKLLLARAMMTSPQLLILDEPTSGLDVLHASEVRKLLHSLKEEGVTIILSSHNMQEVADLADRIGIMAQGTIKTEGTLAELKANYKTSNLEDIFIQIIS